MNNRILLALLISSLMHSLCFAQYTESRGKTLTNPVTVNMNGSSATFSWTGNAGESIGFGSAATVIFRPDAGGSSPLELGDAALWIELGSQWILDGSNYSGTYNIGDRFYLANYGEFNGAKRNIRFRNFNLPANRELQLNITATTMYYEIVEQMAAQGPNIILINVDDMTAGQFWGFEGRPVKSPTMNNLVNNGINFTQSFATSTVCGPSRYSTMTGRYASRNTSEHLESIYPPGSVMRFGVSDTGLEKDGESLGFWLQQAGYRTGIVGKVHLIDDELLNTANWASKGLITYSRTADPAQNANVNAAMKHNHRALCQYMRDYGFDYVDGIYRANHKELHSDFLDYHNQEWLTRNAIDFIDENHNQKFFLYMGPTVNHGPVRNDLSHSLRSDIRYTGEGYLPNEDYSFMPTRQSIINEVNSKGFEEKTARQTWLDHSIKALLNKLTEHGIRNNTLLIFTADHGFDTQFNNTVRRGKSSLYDMGLHVPLVMNWPAGITNPGRSYNEFVQNIDFAATFLELAGVSDLPKRKLDGLSLVDVFNGSSAPVRSEIFSEIGYARCVRNKNWKYIAVRYSAEVYEQIANGYKWRHWDTGQDTLNRPYYTNNGGLGQQSANTYPHYFAENQFYDMVNDPQEQNNLFGQRPGNTYLLKRKLAEHMGDIPNRPFPETTNGTIEFGAPLQTSPPTAPTNVNISYPNNTSANITWTDTANNELGFVVEKSVNGGNWQIIFETNKNRTTASVNIPEGRSNTALRVRAYNAYNNSITMDPAMVDRTDESGITFTSQHNNAAAGQEADKAFDNDENTKYLTNNNSSWTQLQFANNNQYTVQWYSVKPALDAPLLPPTNLVVNSSFENGDTTPNAWTITSTAPTQVTRSTFTASEGSASIRLSASGNIAPTYQDIAVSPNTEYEVRVWVQNAAQTAGLAVLDLSDKPTPQTEVQFVINTGAASDWTEYVGTFNSASETSIRLRMFCNAAFSGTVYFDQLTVKRTSAVQANLNDLDPTSWTLSGSNDGIHWTILDIRRGINFSTRARQNFNVTTNFTAFEYYRFDAQSKGAAVQYAEVELFSSASETVDPLLNWMAEHSVNDLDADDDNDGVSNLVEYALGANPKLRDAVGARHPAVSRELNGLRFKFRRERVGVEYIVEQSTDLNSWSEFARITDSHGPVGGDAIVAISEDDMSTGKLFLRLRVDR